MFAEKLKRLVFFPLSSPSLPSQYENDAELKEENVGYYFSSNYRWTAPNTTEKVPGLHAQGNGDHYVA